MTQRLARLALGLYPLAFRRRYGDEMDALLEQTPTRMGTVLDLIRGAALAHVRPTAAATDLVDPPDRVRASVSGVLACWVLFVVAGLGFYKTTEDAPFVSAGQAHPLLGGAHVSVQALAAAGSAAVVLGALPLIFAALAQARRQPSLRRLVLLGPLAVLLFAGLTGVVAAIAHADQSPRPTTVGGVVFVVWGLAGVSCAAVCVVAARRALFALPVARWRLLAAFGCAALVTAAMAAITLATAAYAIALPLDAAHLASGANGPLQAISTSASLVLQVIAMALATTLGVITTRRGWRAAERLRAAPAS